MRGAFTFAVGPARAAQQFAIPSLKETAATPGLIAARWGVFLSIMAAIGLFLFRCVIARPAGRRRRTGRCARSRSRCSRRSPPASCSSRSTCCCPPRSSRRCPRPTSAACSRWSGSPSFGRGITDLEVLLALFAVAAGVAIWLDRPDRAQRSVVELLALGAGIASRRGAARRPRPRRPRRADVAAVARARAGLDPPRGRVGLARGPHRPARAGGAVAADGGCARSGSSSRGSPASRSARSSRSSRPGRPRRSSTSRRSARCGRRPTDGRSW